MVLKDNCCSNSAFVVDADDSSMTRCGLLAPRDQDKRRHVLILCACLLSAQITRVLPGDLRLLRLGGCARAAANRLPRGTVRRAHDRAAAKATASRTAAGGGGLVRHSSGFQAFPNQTNERASVFCYQFYLSLSPSAFSKTSHQIPHFSTVFIFPPSKSETARPRWSNPRELSGTLPRRSLRIRVC